MPRRAKIPTPSVPNTRRGSSRIQAKKAEGVQHFYQLKDQELAIVFKGATEDTTSEQKDLIEGLSPEIMDEIRREVQTMLDCAVEESEDVSISSQEKLVQLSSFIRRTLARFKRPKLTDLVINAIATKF